jgi:hypothetical protein
MSDLVTLQVAYDMNFKFRSVPLSEKMSMTEKDHLA